MKGVLAPLHPPGPSRMYLLFCHPFPCFIYILTRDLTRVNVHAPLVNAGRPVEVPGVPAAISRLLGFTEVERQGSAREGKLLLFSSEWLGGEARP